MTRPYREHRPHPALEPFVACYWSYQGRHAGLGASRAEAVVPDACMDLLFDRRTGSAAVVGAMTRPLPVLREEGTDLFGVRFRPGAARVFVGLPAAQATDLALELGSVLGREGEAVRRRVSELDAGADVAPAVDAFLLERLGRRGTGRDERVRAAVGMLTRSNGAVRVDDLARRVGLGRRQLERDFLAWVGLGPKATGRILRFQAALDRMLSRPAASLSSIAFAAGYHDQAHFTREFRTLSGEPPGAYRARRDPERADDASVQDHASAPA